MLKGGLRLVLTFAVLGSVAACHRPPPNVVLITVDALRADYLSYADHPRPTSPHLDALAGDSIVFTHAMTSFPGTAPAMPSLMTGLSPSFEGVDVWTRTSRHGFNDWESEGERERPGISDNLRMLAEILQEKGYTTIGFNTNPNISKSTNFHQGFQEYEQFLPYLDRVRSARSHPLAGTYPPAKVVVNTVLRRLRKGLDQPAFIWVHLMDTHSPYFPPERYAQMFRRGDTKCTDLEINESVYHLLYIQEGSLGAAHRYLSPEARGLSRAEFLDHLTGLYEAEIRYFDDQLARLFDALRADSMWDNTLVLVTSDHGEEFLDHGHVVHHDLTGLAEELIRIPAILKPPGWKPRVRTIHELVRMIDFAPTILDYAGLRAEGAHMDGISLRPLIDGRETAPLTAYFSTINFGIARDSHWKYRLVKRPMDDGPTRELLFDIVADPLETHDVFEVHPEVANEMRARYQAFIQSLATRAVPAAVGPGNTHDEIDTEEQERLEALGYVNQ